MGCSSSNKKKNPVEPETPKNDFFEAYKSFKENIILYKKVEYRSVSFKGYLISTKTIPKFIELIKNRNILKHLFKDNNKKDNIIINEDSNIVELENSLKEDLKNYVLEKNIEIYYDYNKCIDLKGKDNEENEFIIVGKEFIDKMNAIPEEKKGIEIIIDIEKDDNDHKPTIERKIKFLQNNSSIGFKEIELGFYKFVDCVKEPLIDNNNNNNIINPEVVIENNH